MSRHIITGALCLLAGLWLGYLLWRPDTVVEGHAPAVILPSGGLLVERDPDAPVPADIRQAAREAGGVLERAVTVTIRPDTIAAPAALPDAAPSRVAESDPVLEQPACSCADVRVELGLIRMPDSTRRVVATARGGDIVGGLDIPVETLSSDRSTKRWAAGLSLSYDMSQRRAVGAWVDRDVGRLRLGVELSQRDGGTATVRAGIRF